MVLAVITRWGTSNCLIHSILRSKDALRAYAFEPTRANSDLRENAVDIIKNSLFWSNLKTLKDVIEPVDEQVRMAEKSWITFERNNLRHISCDKSSTFIRLRIIWCQRMCQRRLLRKVCKIPSNFSTTIQTTIRTSHCWQTSCRAVPKKVHSIRQRLVGYKERILSASGSYRPCFRRVWARWQCVYH